MGWALSLVLATPLAAQEEGASGSSMPFSKAWSIASQGEAASSGELLFRVTPSNGEDPVEVSVFVLSGSNETGVASSIRRALSTQLDSRAYDVEAGQGANVLVTSEDTTAAGQASAGFSIELIDSDVDNVRVQVQSAAPVAPPTVPQQATPATPPNSNAPGAPGTPGAPGNAAPERNPQAPANSPAPAAPPPDVQTSPPPATSPPQTPTSPQPRAPAPGAPASPTPAPGTPGSNADGGAGAPASAPPPPQAVS